MRTFLLVLLSFFFLAGCQKVVRIGPNYQAEVEADADFAAAVVPVLEEKLHALRASGEEEACVAVASPYIYGKWWVPYISQLRLAAVNLGDSPKTEPKPPTPAALCSQEQ